MEKKIKNKSELQNITNTMVLNTQKYKIKKEVFVVLNKKEQINKAFV